MSQEIIKQELLDAAYSGIKDYLATIRGARLRAEVNVIGARHRFGVIQIRVPTEAGPGYYQVKVTKVLKGL